MKKQTLLLIILGIFFTACEGYKDYQVRILSTGAKVTIDCMRLPFVKVGDTVMIVRTDHDFSWEFNQSEVYYKDTAYKVSFVDTDNQDVTFNVQKRVGVVEAIE